MCGKVKEEGYKIGRQGKSFRCHDCGQLHARMHRLLKREGGVAVDWEKLTPTQKKSFYETNPDTYGDDLLQATLSFVKEHITTFTATKTGEYHPLNVWKNHFHYDDNQVAGIKKNGDEVNSDAKRWDQVLNCYTYQNVVEANGEKNEDVTKDRSVRMPKRRGSTAMSSTGSDLKKRRRLSRKVSAASAASGTSAFSTGTVKSAGSGGRQLDPVHRAAKKAASLMRKRLKRIEQQKTKRDDLKAERDAARARTQRLSTANKSLSMFTPILVQLEELVMEKLADPILRGRVPEYMLKQGEAKLLELKQLDTALKAVIKAEGVKPLPNLQDAQPKAKEYTDTIKSLKDAIKVCCV